MRTRSAGIVANQNKLRGADLCDNTSPTIYISWKIQFILVFPKMKTFCCTLLLLLGSALHCGAAGSRCRGGFHMHSGSCYWFSNMQGTFAEARSICRFLGSDLASITSAAEDAFIRGYATQRGKAKVYYLGGADLGLEGSWRWTKNKPFTFTNWGSGQPGNYENNEHCLALQGSDEYRWHDYNCDFIANFICKM